MLFSNDYVYLKPFMPKIIPLITNSDLLTRKLACWIVQNCASDADSMILAVNVLIKDSSDSNPIVRALAIKTLCCMPQLFVAEYVSPILIKTLSDSSAYVRRVSTLACGKIFHHQSSNDGLNEEIIDKLYSLIRDEDTIVVINSLNVLDELLIKEGGIVVSRNIAHYLLGRMQTFDAVSLLQIFGFLKKYHPADDDEIIDIMNVADSYLKHSQAAVVVCSVDYFIYLIKDLHHLSSDIIARASDGIIRGLSCGNHEICFQILNYLESMLQNYTFTKNLGKNLPISLFFLKHTDPEWLKIKKLTILSYITTEDLLDTVLKEIITYVTNHSITVATESVKTIGNLLALFYNTNTISHAAGEFVHLLMQRVSYVTDAVLQALCILDLPALGIVSKVMQWISLENIELLTESSQISVITLIGLHGCNLASAPYIIETCLENFENKSDSFVSALLTAVMRLFYAKPPECQEILGKIMERCSQRRDVNLRENSLIFVSLLSAGVHASEELFSNDKKN